MRSVLVVAGVDSTGGSGLLRDTRTLTEMGMESVCAVTAVTAQTDAKLIQVHHVPPPCISAQIDAARAAGRVSGVKIGMLGNAATVAAVAGSWVASQNRVPIVLDPVLQSTSGGLLLDSEGLDAMRKALFPVSTLVTPNRLEAALLLGCDPARDETEVVDQARQLLALGCNAVLLKGGHGTEEEAADILVSRSGVVRRFAMARLNASMRGTGCALASAIAARLATGAELEAACHEAKQYVHRLIETSDSGASGRYHSRR